MAGVEWPSALPMSKRETPWKEAMVAKEWRRPWRVTRGRLFFRTKRVKARERALGE